MSNYDKRIRVLYSYPFKLGAERICGTAWQLVKGLIDADADLLVFPGVLHRPLDTEVKPTLAWGKVRIPYRLLGSMRAAILHDWIVARRLEKLAGQIDLVHTWSLAAERTLKTATRLGIPTVLERPNAHTRFAYKVVQEECNRLGVTLSQDHEHAYNEERLQKEEIEYDLAYRLLCPSDFVVKTFLDQGFSKKRLARHQYGYDETLFYPDNKKRENKPGLKVLYVGGCAPRKGLHYALEAWLKSPAHLEGEFWIAGEFVPDYENILTPMLKQPSIKKLGHRSDVPDLMRQCDILVLPTIEEGSALVTYEARACGCVLLVSEAAGAICEHKVNALVHRVGDVETLCEHFTLLNNDQSYLEKLRTSSLDTAPDITWKKGSEKLLNAYKQIIDEYCYDQK